jgi:DUF2075 family protein
MLAGYCWKWVSKKDSQLKDIVIGDYSATWNLNSHGQSWIIHPDSVKEIGCIHTSQGLELDYVGVIIGPDLIIRNGEIINKEEIESANTYIKNSNRSYHFEGLKKYNKSNLFYINWGS